MNNPTTKTYTSLTTTYEFFNQELFCGSLPPCLITMQRHKGAYGYFSGDRFANTSDTKEVTDEIALNPNYFSTRKPSEVLSTLAHEMCHLWQHHFGRYSGGGYHNKQWAAKMHEIGLIPTDTGEIGGKETGQRMTHVIEENGRFACAVAKLLADHQAILYSDRSVTIATPVSVKRAADKVASKTKYTCPGCGLHAWAHPDTPLHPVKLICGNCQEPMRA